MGLTFSMSLEKQIKNVLDVFAPGAKFYLDTRGWEDPRPLLKVRTADGADFEGYDISGVLQTVVTHHRCTQRILGEAP